MDVNLVGVDASHGTTTYLNKHDRSFGVMCVAAKGTISDYGERSPPVAGARPSPMPR
jgi:hypothetical protein